MSLAQLPNRANFEAKEGEALNDSHGDVVLQVGGDETIQKGPAKRQADHVIREVSKKRSLEMKGNDNDSSSSSGSSDEVEEMEDEELRAQIKAQLVSATPIFDSKGLTSLHRVAESGIGGVVVARLLAACPALMDSVSQRGGKEESDPSNPATANPAAAYDGRTALHSAARNGHAAIVGQLLAVNLVSVDARTKEGFTVLHCAARGGHAAIVTQVLAANPALIDVKADDGCTVLHSAARGGDAGIVAKLLAVNPTLLNAKDNDGRTVLHDAALWGHAAIVAQLLAVNSTLIDARDHNGRTALHYAAQGGHAAIVSQLLAANPTLVDVRAHDNGETAFHCAARGGHAAIMTHLMTVSPTSVEARMNATAQSESEAKWRSEMDRIKDGDLRAQIRAQLLSEVPLPGGRAALYLASGKGLGEVAARLLAVCPGLLDVIDFAAEHSAFGLAEPVSGPLHLAAQNGHTAIVAQLLAVNPNLAEARDHHGGTALHCAAHYGHAAIVAQLLAVNPALIEARNLAGITALHEGAAQHGRAMAKFPAFRKAMDKYSATVLSRATQGLDPAVGSEPLTAVVSLLLAAAKPALVDARDDDGNTVLHHAVAGGNAAIVAQVLAAMNPALIDVTGALGATALYDAAVGGHAAIVAQLLAAYPGLAHSSSGGRVLLGVIRYGYSGHAEIATQLLAANPALIDAKADDDGDTVLHCCIMRGSGNEEALIAQLLAAKPALIEARSNNGQTALHRAAHYGQAERVAQLLAAKASIEARANNGKTVLHCAVFGKHSEIVSQLLAANPALIEARMDDGKTVLHCAEGHNEITAQLLAAHPALLDAMINDTDSWRALLNVVQMGHEEAVGRLLTMHPELVHQTSDCGWTVFHFAAFYGRDKVMSRLLASQPDLRQLEQLLVRRSTACFGFASQGSTALHVVATIKFTDLASRTSIITQLLAACPALIDIVDDDNQTCVHYAARWLRDSTIELLLSFKPALVHAVDAKGNTILHTMVRKWHYDDFVGRDILQRVWKMNPAALHAVNCERSTPFVVAVRAPNEVAIELLQWSLTFDEVMSALNDASSRRYRKNNVARFKSLMRLQCGELSAFLLPDVVITVLEYVGVTRKSRPRPVKQVPMEQLPHQERVGDQSDSTSASDDDSTLSDN